MLPVAYHVYAFSMVSFKQLNGHYLKPRLARLHEIQEEIFRQLQLLIPEQVIHYDSFVSHVSGSPQLRMDILERHRYTQFIRLTYKFANGEEPELAPDAHIRLYQDARMAEVTSFNPDQGCRRTASPFYPHRQLFQKNWRQNLALDKWLGYLLQQGHNVTSMRPSNDCIEDKRAVKITVPVA
ncbi:MAG: hypothetical protein ACI9CB_000589 [Rhodothermales bacterium]